MARSSDLARIDQVNVIRKRRLAQALSDSRRSAELAAAEVRRAEERARQAQRSQAEAHDVFLTRPSDAQAMLWRDVMMDKTRLARSEKEAALGRSSSAQADVRTCVQAMTRHEVRSNRIALWGARARADDAKASENRNDDDDAPGQGGRPV